MSLHCPLFTTSLECVNYRGLEEILRYLGLLVLESIFPKWRVKSVAVAADSLSRNTLQTDPQHASTIENT